MDLSFLGVSLSSFVELCRVQNSKKRELAHTKMHILGEELFGVLNILF